MHGREADRSYLVAAREARVVSSPSAGIDVASALVERRYHLAALALVVVAFGVAALVGTSVAYYAAALLAFSVWMGWFVQTVVDWLRHAEF